jgi:hypothetical protein
VQVEVFRSKNLPRNIAASARRRKMGISPAITPFLDEHRGQYCRRIYYYQDNIRFCYNARGFLDETLSHIAFANKIGYLPEQLYQVLEQEGEELTRMINGYISYLKKSKQGISEPGANYSTQEIQEPDHSDAPDQRN